MIKYMGHSGWIGADTAMEESIPWLRPGATAYIESLLPEANVFEWGSGASTLWFAKRGYCVTSLELDKSWVELIRGKIKGANIRLLDFSPSTLQNMEEYADCILHSLDNEYDLILIDGRNRNRCLGNCRSKVKIGGIICLDNSERTEYAKSVQLMDSWDGYEWGDEGWKSCCWTRLPESNIERVEFETEDA
jgi:predicted O-methyltransferase YrrM